MAAGSLAVHWHIQHGVDAGERTKWEAPNPYGETQTYWISFLTMVGLRE